MLNNDAVAGLQGNSECSMKGGGHIAAKLKQRYTMECHDKDGKLKWRNEFENLVTTAGLNKYLDACLKTGLTTPVWYVGLKLAGTVVVGDTMASHAGWTESTIYSNATRPAWTPGAVAAGSVDNSASKAVFNINGTDTIIGSFLTDQSAKGGSTGTLLGGGDMTPSRSVISGDTISVTITCSLS
jgi:hypothetical protein